jgi:hypothetical protein
MGVVVVPSHLGSSVVAERQDKFDPTNKNLQHQVLRQVARRSLLELGLLTIARTSLALPPDRTKRTRISARAQVRQIDIVYAMAEEERELAGNSDLASGWLRPNTFRLIPRALR